MFWTHLNPLESPKPPRKSKKVIFRELKIGAGVLKVALKYFLLVLGPKIFRWPLPYLHSGKVSDLGHPQNPLIRIKCEKPLGGHYVTCMNILKTPIFYCVLCPQCHNVDLTTCLMVRMIDSPLSQLIFIVSLCRTELQNWDFLHPASAKL